MRLTYREPQTGNVYLYSTYVNAIGRLADLEDLEEQGLLLRLPCKAGDMVYCIMNNSDACSECPHYLDFYGMDSRCTKDRWNTVYNPKWKREPVCDEHFYEIIEVEADLEYIARHLNDFGKSVFLTKEEAEAALEKMKGEEHETD